MTATDRYDSHLDREMPRDVAAQFQTVLGLDDRPATLRDWADATADMLAAADLSIGLEELCVTDDSRHEARAGGETRHFLCVLDTLLVPFVVDEWPVHVQSRDPRSDELVELDVDTDGVTADPETAVVSFGVARNVDRAADPDDVASEFGYAAFCPYINAFPDEAAYEAWDEETTEAATMPLPPEAALAVAAALTDA